MKNRFGAHGKETSRHTMGREKNLARNQVSVKILEVIHERTLMNFAVFAQQMIYGGVWVDAQERRLTTALWRKWARNQFSICEFITERYFIHDPLRRHRNAIWETTLLPVCPRCQSRFPLKGETNWLNIKGFLCKKNCMKWSCDGGHPSASMNIWRDVTKFLPGTE